MTVNSASSYHLLRSNYNMFKEQAVYKSFINKCSNQVKLVSV